MKASVPAADHAAYIASAPVAAQPLLKKIRAMVKRVAPDAEEVISYRMMAWKLNGILLYVGAFKAHLGLFPPIRGNASLMKAMAPFAGPKGNLQFPYADEIPYDLIERIVKHQVKQNSSRD